MTRAPCWRAISAEPSVLPLSAMITSPGVPIAFNACLALSIQQPTVRASFRHGMTIETSGTASVAVAEPLIGKASVACMVKVQGFRPILDGDGRCDSLREKHRSQAGVEQIAYRLPPRIRAGPAVSPGNG